ncbi:MAG: hypothetical protein CTY22_03395 [Methylomonas sp.]|nr:MAG: hypothetical protein CTY23_02850 [Methylomonas sp.]PPD27000.1 MAG: hypothetical protein CTY22_03395 [Methylomonas sp.]PPD38939.1 MAG: hypothetical protein CTY21_03390 [Methylomonas sp.]PPD42577.1 MAG: hypothetical protein CTY17_01030 [Methylomonas sp.]PPD54151.1 MAG: hypothetical protein CTY11_04225 [Methylomonas sp.]
MPLVSDDPLGSHKQVLGDFTKAIDQLIATENWDELNDLLQRRQHYLAQVFVDPVPTALRDELKRLAQLILQQDALFQSTVQARRNAILQQQITYERGKKALVAYASF